MMRNHLRMVAGPDGLETVNHDDTPFVYRGIQVWTYSAGGYWFIDQHGVRREGTDAAEIRCEIDIMHYAITRVQKCEIDAQALLEAVR